jgi:hypothetical protein
MLKRDLFAQANSTVSLFVQALLGTPDAQGKVYENIAFTMHQRDAENKAIKTVRFFVSEDRAETWGIDLAQPVCTRSFKEEKAPQNGGAGEYRNIEIRPDPKDQTVFVVSIINGTPENRLWIRLDPDMRRALGRRIADAISAYESAKDQAALDEEGHE